VYFIYLFIYLFIYSSLQMFFSATGAMGHIPTVLRIAPALFLHTSLQIAVHFLFSMVVGRGVLKLPFREIVLASNANVGGPTTAAGMAANKKWRSLVLPALLTGIFGYAIATGVALVVAKVVLPLMDMKLLRHAVVPIIVKK
jgi:uncharacterized membrane protein